MDRKRPSDLFAGAGGFDSTLINNASKHWALIDRLGMTLGPVYDVSKMLGMLSTYDRLDRGAFSAWRHLSTFERLSSPSFQLQGAFQAQLKIAEASGLERLFSNLGQTKFGTWIDRQIEQLRGLERALAGTHLQIEHMPIATVTDSLAILGATAEIMSVSPAAIKQTAKLSRAYVAFAKRQSERVLHAETEDQGAAASLVLDHAGAMLGDSNAIWQQTVEDGVGTGDPPQVLPDDLNVFAALNRSVAGRYRLATLEEIETAVNSAPATLIHSLGYELVALVNGLNKTYSLDTGKQLFLPSMWTMEAALLLPNHVANNEADFARVVDALYFMLWEASGSTRGQVYQWMQAGIPEVTRLQLVRDLRRIFRHDLEQESGTETKLIKGGGAFKSLINRPYPLAPAQWRAAQIALYRELCVMLEAIHTRIAPSP